MASWGRAGLPQRGLTSSLKAEAGRDSDLKLYGDIPFKVYSLALSFERVRVGEEKETIFVGGGQRVQPCNTQ
jgi:hypothetical protein